MKKTIQLSSILLTSLLGFFSLESCSSIPKSYKYFLEQEGAPISLEVCPQINNINGDFPDTIYIKTQTQTFSFDYEYLLFNGRIFYKQRGTDKTAWEPFLETGLPFSKKNKFPTVETVTEIAADADVLYCFSDEGKLYRCYTKKITSYTPFEWVEYFGWPFKVQLNQTEILRNKKAWAVGSSRLDVEYYEDIYGNQHNYGPLGVESIPFLCEDGKTIHYSDPACPSDFSHSFRTPDNVILENFSESASTFFAIASDGTLFTRLVDYNTVGSDPMLYDYSYEEVHSDLPGSNKKSNTTTWALPNESWKIQPSLPNGAKATKYVTIIQNGKGNDARELRIAAISPQGLTGFYYKSLNDTNWTFKEAPLTLSDDCFITKSDIKTESNFQKYAGGLWINGNQVPDITCKVDNFHFSEGPFTLNINNQIDIQFYYSEIWTLFMRLNPGLEEEPIRYFGTAVFDEEKISGLSPFAAEIFKGRNKVIHDFYIEAFDTYLLISLTTKKNTYEFYLTETGNIQINPKIDMASAQKSTRLEERLYNQSIFYDEAEDLYKTEIKIAKNKKKLSKNLRDLIHTKKGKHHPIIKVMSPKVAIILKYSGEICNINENYYKTDYKLTKRYLKALKSYEEIIEEDPNYNPEEIFKSYILENSKFSDSQDIEFPDSTDYFPMVAIKQEKGDRPQILYAPKKGNKGIYKYYTGKKKKIKLKKIKTY
ncbi:MAG: hypothetical protein MJ188_09160 [Treponema sp.]|nr:hypothetical protein [Treponema sp.]